MTALARREELSPLMAQAALRARLWATLLVRVLVSALSYLPALAARAFGHLLLPRANPPPMPTLTRSMRRGHMWLNAAQDYVQARSEHVTL